MERKPARLHGPWLFVCNCALPAHGSSASRAGRVSSSDRIPDHEAWPWSCLASMSDISRPGDPPPLIGRWPVSPGRTAQERVARTWRVIPCPLACVAVTGPERHCRTHRGGCSRKQGRRLPQVVREARPLGRLVEPRLSIPTLPGGDALQRRLLACLRAGSSQADSRLRRGVTRDNGE